MKQWLSIFLVFFLSVLLMSCSRAQKLLGKNYAYASAQLPGNIAVDESGQPFKHPVKIVVTVYLESKNDSIHWDSATINGKTFGIRSFPVREATLSVGFDRQTGKQIDILKTQGFSLFALYPDLQGGEWKDVAEIEGKPILLKGRFRNKRITLESSPVIWVEGYPAQ